MSTTTAAVTGPAPTRLGRSAPRILRAEAAARDCGTWQGLLDRAEALGFDHLLLAESTLPIGFAAAARAKGVAVLVDIEVDRAPPNTPAPDQALFALVPAPTLDPRHDPGAAPGALAAIAGLDDALALAMWWGAHIGSLTASGIAGVRLTGLANLPALLVAPFLVRLRAACPGALLFGWTPGLAWDVIGQLPPGVLDLVASSLPWWDGHSDWLWRELDLLRTVAPVVAAAGERADPGRVRLAALLGDGWMASGAEADAAGLNGLRTGPLAGRAWTRLASAAGSPLLALLLTDAPDPRRAGRACLALLNIGRRAPASVEAGPVLAALGGSFGPFTAEHPAGGAPLLPGTRLELAPGELLVFAAKAAAMPATGPLARPAAKQAAQQPRLAIEAPAPCVDGGRFPARRILGSVVHVEADVIGDGHDKFAARLRWRGPGDAGWTEAPMRPLGNDRWAASFPLTRLGVHHYTIRAWRDAFSSFADELAKKHAAGVPTGLELTEGAALVQAAAARSKRQLQAALNQVVRQFGNKDEAARRETLLAPGTAALMGQADDRPHCVSLDRPVPVQAERTGAGFASWYEVFPRSMSDDPARHGTFRDVARHLPRIRAMGFDVLYFPPVHPIGRVNRKGRNNTLTPTPDDPGSPYAIGSDEGGHDALHPELGTIEDFQHLRAACAQHGIELALDFAIQCSPDHPWLKQHKDWFNWRPDGTIRYAENPPKKYEDIVNVDFYAPGAAPDLWVALCDNVLYWARQGVRLFRVDNPHTKPLPFWEWLIAEVQARYPDTVFLAEAFTRPKVMYRLAKAGFSQSYTYFTWRDTKAEFQEYLTELTQGPPAEFFRPHFFVNTPDINPVFLQTSGRPGFLVRAALASTLSGLWGVYNGFELCEGTPVPGREEYLDSEKYQIRAWDWDRPGNIAAEIAQLNAIRRMNPALQTHLGVTFLPAAGDQVLFFEKATPDRSNVVLVAISMDPRQTQHAGLAVPFWRFTPEPADLEASDLLLDRHERWRDRTRRISLAPERPYAIWRIRPAAA